MSHVLLRSSRRPVRIAVAILLLAVFQSGCALVGVGPDSVPPQEQLAFDEALELYPQDTRGTTAALRRFLNAYPKSSLADDAAEKLAELAFAEGREEEGLRWLGKIIREAPNSDRAAPARFRLAQYEYGRDRWDAARSLLEPLRIDRLPLADQRAALRLRVQLAQTPIERLQIQSQLRRTIEQELSERRLPSGKRARLEARLDLLDQQMRGSIRQTSLADLESLLDELRGAPPATEILLELAKRALDLGDPETADRRIAQARALARTEAELDQLNALERRSAGFVASESDRSELPPLRELLGRPRPRTDGGRGKIGVVLPLTGSFAAFGEQSLRGLLLAADLFAPSGRAVESTDAYQPRARFRGDSQIRLIVRDSGGTPEKAAERVRELAADPSIVAIVGPIFTAESNAAAQAAEEAAVPLVSLSHREEIPAGRPYVFRTRTTPADEVGVLVDHAVRELGARRFAVLYPRNRYGRGMRKLYWDAVRARGGKMVAASSYEADAVDFSSAIRDMIGYRFLTDAEQWAIREREETVRAARTLPPAEARKVRQEAYARLGPERLPLPPIVDFDVLFIPDSADKISLIAPGLAYHEVRGVKLLGSSDWVDPELLRVARHHVSGSVISTAFYPQSDLPFVADFVAAFRATFDEEPDAYAAQAFDAGNLILMQLASGREDRVSIREGLLQTRAYPGATGVLTMSADGNARRRPFLLGVQGGRFVPLD